jgi:hypothetical protein
MKSNEKGLQKLTKTEAKFNNLMLKKKIVRSDIQNLLNKEETNQFDNYLTKLFYEKKGVELDNLLEQVSEIITPGSKNQLWETNHWKITVAISKLMEANELMPTKNLIAEATGLSRQTIHKHLKEYITHPLYIEEMRKFKIMSDKVLAKVYKCAIEGQVKAARLYFEVIGYLNTPLNPNTTINTQNNFIQINQMKFSQENIEQLSPEQLNQIEMILKNAISR